jgi:hypothetical protein
VPKACTCSHVGAVAQCTAPTSGWFVGVGRGGPLHGPRKGAQHVLHVPAVVPPAAVPPAVLPRVSVVLGHPVRALWAWGRVGASQVLASSPSSPPARPPLPPPPPGSAFCGDAVEQRGAATGASVFTEVTSDEMRALASRASNGDNDAYEALQALVAPSTAAATCHWAFYTIPRAKPRWYSVPMCTHDPAGDMISGLIHDKGAWFKDASMYTELVEHLPGGVCPPDRPVVRGDASAQLLGAHVLRRAGGRFSAAGGCCVPRGHCRAGAVCLGGIVELALCASGAKWWAAAVWVGAADVLGWPGHASRRLS